MPIIDELNQGLEPRILSGLLFEVLADDLGWVLLDLSNQAVAISAISSPVVEGANDDCLPTGITTLKDNEILLGLRNFTIFKLLLLLCVFRLLTL